MSLTVTEAEPSQSTPFRAGIRIAAMLSGKGRGTNMAALASACGAGEIPGVVAVVIGTRSDSDVIERARSLDLPVAIVSPRKYEEADPAGYGEALLRVLDRYVVDTICLAGYMRALPSEVVSRYAGRVLNVHPALLPLFGGRGMFGEHVHQAVIESGMKVSGCTVHFVDNEYDTGPIIAQAAVPVLSNDTPQSLATRILPEEHRLYVYAAKLLAEDRLTILGKRVLIRDEAAPPTPAEEIHPC